MTTETHVHHWLLEADKLINVRGRCIGCGESRMFNEQAAGLNYIESFTGTTSNFSGADRLRMEAASRKRGANAQKSKAVRGGDGRMMSPPRVRTVIDRITAMQSAGLPVPKDTKPPKSKHHGVPMKPAPGPITRGYMALWPVKGVRK